MERTQSVAVGRFATEDIMMRYAEGIDTGDIESVGALFAKGELAMPDGTTLVGVGEVTEHYTNLIIFYDAEGNVVPYERGQCTPRTRHVISNLRFDFNNAVNRVDVRSYFTVYQTIDGRNEIIAGGHYVDDYGLDLTGWHLVRREIFLDNLGDMTHHLKSSLV